MPISLIEKKWRTVLKWLKMDSRNIFAESAIFGLNEIGGVLKKN